MAPRATPLAIALVFVAISCGGSPGPPAQATPSANGSATSSPFASSPSPPATPSPPAALVHCASAVPAGDNLIIGTVSGDQTVVIRDIQDPARARNLCQFDNSAFSPRFVSASKVAYVTALGEIVEVTLASGTVNRLANPGSGFGPGTYSISPDGRSSTYLSGDAWHLVNASGDHLLTTLPPAPGRGVDPDGDDQMLSFSPDGKFIALFQTIRTGGTGPTAPDQIRRAADGSLAYSTTGMTMAVWASLPSRLFFRDATGSMQRWDPSAGVTPMKDLRWIRPKGSPDGRWVAYTTRTTSGLGAVGLYSVQGNSIAHTSAAGRSGPVFLTNDLVWYIGEKACPTCFGGYPTPTGTTYIYDIAGNSEVASRLTSVLDAWPHTTAPAL